MLYKNIQIFARRTASNLLDMKNLGVAIPADILEHYRIDPHEFDRLGTPPKYRIRPYNLSRDLLRYSQLAPELIDPMAAPQELLELSPGACAAVELLAPFGHRLHLADFEVGPNSKYSPIHDLLGVRPTFFDGTQRPFPFPDRMVDTVLCFQAFDFYTTSEDDYLEIFTELKRIARKKCVIIFNSYRPRLDPPERIEALQVRFAEEHGLRWDICPDSFLLTLVWERDGGQ